MPDPHDSTDLDALVRTIESLQERIRRDGDTIGSNEIRTRTALVDPLLTALGWDTTNPAMVVPEYAAGGGTADYALLKVTPDDGTPVIAFIEAKRLHEPLEPHRAQMLNYANMTGVRYAGLTNGDRWELYEVFKEAPLHERRIMDVSLWHEPAIDCAVKLLLLKWPSPERGNPYSKRNAQILLLRAFVTDASPWIIDTLLDWGPDLRASDGFGWTLLHFAAAHCENPEIMQVLIDRGADMEARDDDGQTPLHCAVRFNFTPEVIVLLVNQGADIESTDNLGWTPLYWAVLEGTYVHRTDSLAEWVAKIEVLLRWGADPTVVDSNGRTPYQIAKTERADEQILRLLRY